MTERKSVVTKKQPSLSEWFEAIEHNDSEALRKEDMRKRDRLEVLRQKIDLDYDRVTAWSAVDFFNRAPEIQNFIDNHGEDLCALRLVPYDAALPKFRTRGRTMNESLPWLNEHGITPEDYTVEFVEHSDTARWSSILVVRDEGVFGELCDGLHFQITKGNTEGESYAFSWDYGNEWKWTNFNENVAAHAKDIVDALLVSESAKQEELVADLDTEFTSDGYIKGYFETLLWPGDRLIFIDYNRLLHDLIELPVLSPSTGSGSNADEAGSGSGAISGTPASKGSARGIVRICTPENLLDIEFNDGDILVTDNTDVTFLPLMKRSGAIITNRGGMLSHAAITSREMGVPCVIGTKCATDMLCDGDEVDVDATAGVVLKIENRKPKQRRKMKRKRRTQNFQLSYFNSYDQTRNTTRSSDHARGLGNLG